MIGTLRTVVLDAPDARLLAAFYTALGGWTELYADDDWITMETGDGWRIAAQLSPDHVPPQWPDPAFPQQAHLDLRVPDLDAGSAKAIGLGAGLLRKNENWYTLADPAGHPFDLCLFPAKQETTLMGVMLDCPDAKQLSTFYAELLGKPVTYEGESVAMIGEDGAQPVMFQQIAEYRAPRWPDPAYPQQFHLDVTVDDVDAAEAAVLKLGATSLSSGGVNWRVYAGGQAVLPLLGLRQATMRHQGRPLLRDLRLDPPDRMPRDHALERREHAARCHPRSAHRNSRSNSRPDTSSAEMPRRGSRSVKPLP
jgi:hypothetical protein